MNCDLEKIKSLVDQGLYRKALDELASISPDDPGESDSTDRLILRMAAATGLGTWAEVFRVGIPLLHDLTARDDRHNAGTVHGMLGNAYLRSGDHKKSEAHIRAAIHILTWDVGNVQEALREQRRLGLMFLATGDFRQAACEFDKGIELADQYGVVREGIGHRINLCVSLVKSGRLDRVPALLDEAEKGAEERTKQLVLCQLVRASYLKLHSSLGKALALLNETLETARAQMYSREEAISLEYIGDCYLAHREFKKALDQYELALKIAEATAPEGDIIPELCHRMGEAKVRLGDPNAAIVLCERGLRVARASSDRYEECATHRVYAMAHRAAGNARKALRIADEGIDLGRRYEIPYELARTLAWAGEIRIEDSSPDEQANGRRLLWEARGIFERMGLVQWLTSVDQLLGFDAQQEDAVERSAIAEVESLGDLDRGSLRFGIVTCNPQVREAVEILQSVAPSQIPVLITGESGVGKELLAQALHQMSSRRKGPFVPVNCGAISVNLLDSEFFGHERGAFTGAITSREGLLASADKGTLFLDEVGDLPLQVQAALLRVLETGEIRAVGRDDVRKVDIRIVAATNAGLEDLVGRGAFRQDLFYRLNGIRVTVPPLREREEDIRALFRYFWAQACASAKKRLKVEEAVESLLCAYDWPGNVRELRHEIARAVALAPDGTSVGADSFLSQLKRRDVGSLRRDRDRREEVSGERQEILLALRAHRGNKAEAARSLGGMKRTTLIYKIERLGIRPEEYQARD